MSESKIQNIEVNGKNLSIQPFKARKGVKIVTKLGRYIAPVVKGLKVDDITSGKALESNVDLDFAEIADALVNALDSDNVLNLVTEILSESIYDGKDLSDANCFDEIFMSNYDSLFLCVKTVLEVNFSSFLSKTGIGNLLSAKR